MKNKIQLLAALWLLLSAGVFAQPHEAFLESFDFKEKIPSRQSGNSAINQQYTGTPYLFPDFLDGVIFLNDTTAVKLPVRFNVFNDEMEYQIDGVSYSPRDRSLLKRVIIDKSVIIFTPDIGSGGYAELLVEGRCSLLQKRKVVFHPAEPPRPIVGTSTPAAFEKDGDQFFLKKSDGKITEVKNLKTVLSFLSEKSTDLEQFMKKEKIKRSNRSNLITIISYYNSL